MNNTVIRIALSFAGFITVLKLNVWILEMGYDWTTAFLVCMGVWLTMIVTMNKLLPRQGKSIL